MRMWLYIGSVLFGFLLLVGSCKTVQVSEERDEILVNVLSYNVRNCRGMDDVTDYQRVAAVIKGFSPDVVALQELDSATRRSLGVAVLDTLATLTGMYESYSGSIPYQGGKYGVGILSREKPLRQRIVPLPGREEKRSLLMVEFRDYWVCSTHFTLTQADRITSVDLVNRAVQGITKPVLMAGDFNVGPESAEIKALENSWFLLNSPKMPTFPASNPRTTIDYIFGSRTTGHIFEVVRLIVGNEPIASDHLPVFAEIRIR